MPLPGFATAPAICFLLFVCFFGVGSHQRVANNGDKLTNFNPALAHFLALLNQLEDKNSDLWNVNYDFYSAFSQPEQGATVLGCYPSQSCEHCSWPSPISQWKMQESLTDFRVELCSWKSSKTNTHKINLFGITDSCYSIYSFCYTVNKQGWGQRGARILSTVPMQSYKNITLGSWTWELQV